MTKHVIWSNCYEALEACENYLREEEPGMTEEKIQREAWQIIDNQLDTERSNLDVPLEGKVIILAELGLWDGLRKAYKEVAADTIGDCLQVHDDFCTWYIDDNDDLCCNGAHHDGTNFYRYREWKPGLGERAMDNFREHLRNGTPTEKHINYYTRNIGKRVCTVYGW